MTGAGGAVVVATLGEAFVDFVSSPGQPPWTFVVRPGGARANVAVCQARLGTCFAFVGRVDRDPLRGEVAHDLDVAGVDLHALQCDDARHTMIAFSCPPSPNFERFLVDQADTADGALVVDRGARNLVAAARVLHISTISLATESSRTATGPLCRSLARTGSRCRSTSTCVPRPGSHPIPPSGGLGAARPRGHCEAHERGTRGLGCDANELLRRGVGVLLVADGPADVSLFNTRGQVRIAAPNVPAVEPTGTGDAAFLRALLTRAIHLACTLSAPSDPRRRREPWRSRTRVRRTACRRSRNLRPRWRRTLRLV